MTELDDIADLALNEDLEVYVDARGDLATVSGRGAFEQELMVRIRSRYTDLIGSGQSDQSIRDVLRVEARRVADEMDQLADIAFFDIEQSDDNTDLFEVTVVYDTGDSLTFTTD